MRVATIVWMSLFLAVPALADTPFHFFADGEIIFQDTNEPRRACRWVGTVEVKTRTAEFPEYKTAYSYTLHNPTPAGFLDAYCRVPTGDFNSIVRCFTVRNGLLGLDLVTLRFSVLAMPRDPAVQRLFSVAPFTPTFGFDVHWHPLRITQTAGGIEVFVYTPKGPF